MSGKATPAHIVATLGPSSARPSAVRALREAGADAVRLNGSHLDVAGLRHFVALADEGGFEGGRTTLDLQGGKVRLGTLEVPVEVVPGQTVRLVPASGRPIDRASPPLPVYRAEFQA